MSTDDKSDETMTSPMMDGAEEATAEEKTDGLAEQADADHRDGGGTGSREGDVRERAAQHDAQSDV
ncbi:hypothetical protein ES689_00055 [Frigoribacterium sp. ACAM 257]|uniref:hypothetical protein n=1 Tax=Frigoribacterium sp. ACAM 257 TaxID=2508998 RepID=UPI0011B9A33B|nr:hypothetical protein [Frigoribacterium sp. ACAM 257]TWX39938.1 hypothetical protein ES689_00055 [Frigoribacterium sp. ACAM 257]